MTEKHITKQIVSGDVKVLANYHVKQRGESIVVTGDIKIIVPEEWGRWEDHELINYMHKHLPLWFSPQSCWWESLYMRERNVKSASQAQRLIQRSLERVHDALAAAMGERAKHKSEILAITI